MSIFHRHHWSEVGRTYTEPATGRVKSFDEQGRNLDFTARILYGFTTIELRCDDCGLVRHVQHTGKGYQRPSNRVIPGMLQQQRIGTEPYPPRTPKPR